MSHPVPLIGETIGRLILNNNILLFGLVLLVIAVVLEVINGLIDVAVYTALLGGLALTGYGVYVYIV